MEQEQEQEQELNNDHKKKLEAVMAMSDDQFRSFVVEQMRFYETEFRQYKELLQQNTELTSAINASTQEMVSIFKGAKTGATVFVWLGVNIRRLIKFLYPFVLFGAAIWALMHGKWPSDK